MANTERDGAAAYGKVIAKAWRDPSFKAKLIADPQGTLRQAGISIPAGVTVQVVENTATHLHFVLPARPAGQLSDEALDAAAGGVIVFPGKPGVWPGGASSYG
jgi:hypothetical protein